MCAHTSIVKRPVPFSAKRDVVFESQLPKGMSGDRLRTLEEGPKMGEPMSPETEAEPPRFVKEVSYLGWTNYRYLLFFEVHTMKIMSNVSAHKNVSLTVGYLT